MKSRLVLLTWIAVISLVTTSLLFWFFEKGTNEDINGYFDVLWWWVVTSGTVGYGDIVPVTWQGRLVGVVAIFTGFFIFANLIAIIAESIHAFVERKSRGTVRVTARNHIVLCEYTAITDELIQSLPHCEKLANREVVIISDLVTRNPYPQHHYVRGVSINPASLQQANVKEADFVFIFANLRFADPDVKTMHIASRVRDINSDATLFVELVDPKNELLKYARARVIPMDSRKLMEAVLRDKRIDPFMFVEQESGRDETD